MHPELRHGVRRAPRSVAYDELAADYNCGGIVRASTNPLTPDLTGAHGYLDMLGTRNKNRCDSSRDNSKQSRSILTCDEAASRARIWLG